MVWTEGSQTQKSFTMAMCIRCDLLAFRGRRRSCLCFVVPSAHPWGPCWVDSHLSSLFPIGGSPRALPILAPGPLWSPSLLRDLFWHSCFGCPKASGSHLSRQCGYPERRSVASVRGWLRKHPASHPSGNDGPSASLREENMPGAVCGWGTNVHMLAGLAGGDFSHYWRKHEKRLLHLPASGCPKTPSTSALLGLWGA